MPEILSIQIEATQILWDGKEYLLIPRHALAGLAVRPDGQKRKEEPDGVAKPKRAAKPPTRPAKKRSAPLMDAILDILGDKNWMTRPELLAALGKRGIRTTDELIGQALREMAARLQVTHEEDPEDLGMRKWHKLL